MHPAAQPRPMQLVSANLHALLPRLLPVIPVLREPFYMLGSHRVCGNVWNIDWGMPREAKLIVVNDPYALYGVKGEGKVIWEAPDAWDVFRHNYADVRLLARQRGFEIKPTLEFITWLKKHMQHLVRAQASDGLHVLVLSLLKQR